MKIRCYHLCGCVADGLGGCVSWSFMMPRTCAQCICREYEREREREREKEREEGGREKHREKRRKACTLRLCMYADTGRAIARILM